MKFTLDQALHTGIEAHKSGQLEEADKYYSAIIAARPDHPDANHNLGVLAVGIGKVEEALRFFQVAIHSKPQIIQFWLSHIDALIKLDRTGEAKNVFNEAKKNGLNSESLEAMKKIQEGYGYGLFQIPFYSSLGFGHTGGIDGFSSVFAHFPEENISYALTSNGTIIRERVIQQMRSPSGPKPTSQTSFCSIRRLIISDYFGP